MYTAQEHELLLLFKPDNVLCELLELNEARGLHFRWFVWCRDQGLGRSIMFPASTGSG